MLPSFRHRLWMTGCTIASALIWRLAVPWLEPMTLNDGWTLSSTALGLGGASGALMLVSLPVIGLSLLSAWTGHAMTGPFVWATSLTLLTLTTGDTFGWASGASLPGDYRRLALETPCWFLPLLLLWGLISLTQARLQKRFPRWVLSPQDHLQDVPDDLPNHPMRRLGGILLTMLISAVTGAGASYLLLTDGRSGQLVGGLIIGFALGGMLTRLLLPTMAHPLGLLMGPMAVSITVDLITAGQYRSSTSLLADWHQGRIVGLAYALPMHYASAAVTGACLGFGWGQALSAAHPGTSTAPDNSPSSSPA